MNRYYIALNDEYCCDFDAEQFDFFKRNLGGTVLERVNSYDGSGKTYTLFVNSPKLYAEEKELISKLAEDQKPVTVAMLRQMLNAGAFK